MITFPTKTVTIANGASLSGILELGGGILTGMILPAAWTAAGITFQGSVDGTNFYNLYDEFGAEITLTVDASRYIRLNPTDNYSIPYMKLRSGTSGSAVNQGADRILTLIIR